MADAILDKESADLKQKNAIIDGMATVLQEEGIPTIGDIFTAANVTRHTERVKIGLETIGMRLEDPIEDFLRWAQFKNWDIDIGLFDIDRLKLKGYLLDIYDRYKANYM
jgi:hypothetical protein